ncbi:MAG: glycosyltransferase family 2 protein [Thermodesulfobacteriota bacterium]
MSVDGFVTLNDKYATTRLLLPGEATCGGMLCGFRQSQTCGGLRSKGYFKKSLGDRPLVSVITTTFNSEKYFTETIESVITQRYDNIEYIVVDGCSTDGTVDILRRYDDRIDFWLSEPDGSMYEAINKGIAQSRGEIIAVLNSDDRYINEDVVSQMVKWLRISPDVGGVYGDLIRLYATHTRYKKVFQVGYRRYLLSQGGTFVPHPALFVRRNCIEKTGVYDTRYRYASDYDFILRCLKYCRLQYINMPVTYFRVHAASITSSGVISKEKLAVLKDHGIDRYWRLEKKIMYIFLWGKYALLNVFNRKRALRGRNLRVTD